MITIQSIDSVLYEVAGLDVTRRRKNILLPLILFVAGAALSVWAVTSPAFAERASLSAALMMLGAIVAIIGLVKLFLAFSAKGIIPVCARTGSRLHRTEVYYDAKDKNKLRLLLATGAFKDLSSIDRRDSSNVLLTVYSTRNGSVVLAQVSEYVPHSFEPITEVYKFTDLQGEALVAAFA